MFIDSFPNTRFVHFLRNIDRRQGYFHNIAVSQWDLKISTRSKLHILFGILICTFKKVELKEIISKLTPLSLSFHSSSSPLWLVSGMTSSSIFNSLLVNRKSSDFLIPIITTSCKCFYLSFISESLKNNPSTYHNGKQNAGGAEGFNCP